MYDVWQDGTKPKPQIKTRTFSQDSTRWPPDRVGNWCTTWFSALGKVVIKLEPGANTIEKFIHKLASFFNGRRRRGRGFVEDKYRTGEVNNNTLSSHNTDRVDS